MVIAGSVVERVLKYGRDVTVAGAGLLGPLSSSATRPALGKGLRFEFVRGPLTATELGLPARLGLGDPALLLDPPSSEAGQPLMLSHFHSYIHQRDAVAQQADAANARLLWSFDPHAQILEAIAAAPWVLTDSLHGVIMADAFGVPVIRFNRTDLARFDFRFADYLSSIHCSAPPVLQIGSSSLELRSAVSAAASRRDGIEPSMLGIKRRLFDALGEAMSR